MFFIFCSRTPNLGYNFETNTGNPFHYFSYGVACSEVEIDCLTGDHKVRSLQNFSSKGGWERETTELEPQETNSVVGKTVSPITAQQTPWAGPESKRSRLSGPQRRCLDIIIAEHRRPWTRENK